MYNVINYTIYENEKYTLEINNAKYTRHNFNIPHTQCLIMLLINNYNGQVETVVYIWNEMHHVGAVRKINMQK